MGLTMETQSYIYMAIISKNDKNLQCIFIQPGYFTPMVVEPLVPLDKHITCKTPAINLFCAHSNHSRLHAEIIIANLSAAVIVNKAHLST